MRAVDQSSRKRPRSAGRRGGLLLSVAVLLALAGCESGYGSKQRDPMLGMNAPPPIPAPAPAAGGGAASTQTATNTTPPLPGSSTVANQAALASGTTQAPDDPRALRIATPPVVPVSSPGGAARGASPGNVRVDGPVPVPETTSKTMPAPVASTEMRPADGTVAPPPPGGIATFEQGLQYLKQKGVKWQRLDGDQGQWKFQCSLPIPGNALMGRTYETKATDPLSAVRAVIDKIDKDQR